LGFDSHQYVVRQDAISWSLTFLVGAIFLYNSAIFLGGWTDLAITSVFMMVVMMFGLLMNIVLTGKVDRDESIDRNETQEIFYFSGLAFAVIALTNWMIPVVVPVALGTAVLQGLNLRLYAIFVATAEEQFFRAFVTPFFANRIGFAGGCIASGAFFAVYHLGAYKTDLNILTIVFLSGMVLSYIALKTQRVSPSMIAHAIVNFSAAGGFFWG